MSWNSSIQFAKLYKAFLTLSTTALTNPMVSNLNMATYSINNVNTISAVSGNTLSLSADSSQGITVNTKLLIPNHPLVITNNTVNDSLQVYDTTPDTTIFRVDHNGNVSIKADPSTVLTEAFTVNGQSTFAGGITCSGLTSGFGTFSSLVAPTRSSGDNTTNVATTAFVQSAITSTAVRAVRNTSMLTSSFSGSFTINNDLIPTRATGITITLPSAFTGYNVFTIYIRNLGITSSSTVSSGQVEIRAFFSKTDAGSIVVSEGGTNIFSVLTNNSSTFNSITNRTVNWCPIGGLTSNTIYLVFSGEIITPSSTTTITGITLEYDIVGDVMTLA
jgi:hypothetical protein